jgi:cell wall-associated NlpC family hydrolase
MFKNTLKRGSLLAGMAILGLFLSISSPVDSFARQHHRSGKTVRKASHSARTGRHGKSSSKKHHFASRALSDSEKDAIIEKLQTIAGVSVDSLSTEDSLATLSDAMQSAANEIFGSNYSLLTDPSLTERDATAVALDSDGLRLTNVNATTDSVVAATKSDVVEHIIGWLGTPYVFGGASSKGIDCSAFTRGIYRESFNVNLPRTAYMQSVLGTQVGRNQLQFGDMVFFKTARYAPVTHVGIYVGDGLFANSQGSRGVTLASLEDPYWSAKFLFGKRLFTDTKTAHTEVNKSIDYALASGDLEPDFHKFD